MCQETAMQGTYNNSSHFCNCTKDLIQHMLKHLKHAEATGQWEGVLGMVTQNKRPPPQGTTQQKVHTRLIPKTLIRALPNSS